MKRISIILFILLTVLMECRQEGVSLVGWKRFSKTEKKTEAKSGINTGVGTETNAGKKDEAGKEEANPADDTTKEEESEVNPTDDAKEKGEVKDKGNTGSGASVATATTETNVAVPTSAPAPASVTEPTRDPEPANTPEPANKPELASVPVPTSAPEPASAPASTSVPVPKSTEPAKVPEPANAPVPVSAPEPTSVPAPTSVAEPASVPAPTSAAEPASVAVPASSGPEVKPTDDAESKAKEQEDKKNAVQDSIQQDSVDSTKKAEEPKQDPYLELERRVKSFKRELDDAKSTFVSQGHSFTALVDRLSKIGGITIRYGHYSTPKVQHNIYSSLKYDALDIKQFEEIFVKLPLNRVDLGGSDNKYIARLLVTLLNGIGNLTNGVVNESFKDAGLAKLKNSQDATVVPTALKLLNEFISKREELINNIQKQLSRAGAQKNNEALMRAELLKITDKNSDINKENKNLDNIRKNIRKIVK